MITDISFWGEVTILFETFRYMILILNGVEIVVEKRNSREN